MNDFVIVDGDQAVFLPAFGAATVMVRPGPISGTGPAKATGPAMCVEGDEASVSVAPCMYVAPPYVIPGTGTLTVDRLGGDQLAQAVAGRKKLILKGREFTAKFSVNSPAQQPQPTGTTPDPTPSYTGQGSFVTANTSVKAR